MRGKAFNHLPAVAAILPHAAEQLVEKLTIDIAAIAANNAPVDTGNLAQSYTYERDGKDGIAGTNVEYAPYVEFGTRFAGAQPHLVPAAAEVEAKVTVMATHLGNSVIEAADHG